ncbi:UNKNOWN [Stylonychia lemnae]|uniref:Uncharacterized protein n=1 Tax=Stylonychia lemnae TaxID=5949 RepID=A0A078A9F9_STYLE|nr:UNKNOWN [Stylonychia lemnae]|eukprot:CDW78232.1 UNKNOWN [Stylonychia lemnae]
MLNNIDTVNKTMNQYKGLIQSLIETINPIKSTEKQMKFIIIAKKALLQPVTANKAPIISK